MAGASLAALAAQTEMAGRGGGQEAVEWVPSLALVVPGLPVLSSICPALFPSTLVYLPVPVLLVPPLFGPPAASSACAPVLGNTHTG